MYTYVRVRLFMFQTWDRSRCTTAVDDLCKSRLIQITPGKHVRKSVVLHRSRAANMIYVDSGGRINQES